MGGPARNYTPDSKPQRPVYTPATYLVGSTPFTKAQLVAQYQEFNDSLSYVSAAPELVFERLVGNLKEIFGCQLEEEREKHAAAIKALELSNAQLREEIAGLKGVSSVGRILGTSGAFASATEILQTATDTCSSAVMNRAPRNPIIGALNSTTAKEIVFATPYSEPPILPIGLTKIDVDFAYPNSVCSYTTDANGDAFKVHIDSGKDRMLHGAGCAWLEIEVNDPYFQAGVYNTADDPPGRPNAHNERKIIFTRQYSTPPIVVVWLAGFKMNDGGSWRIKTYATDITKSGFTIHIDSWKDTVIDFGIASWVSYPANMPGVSSGRVSTLDFRPWYQPQHDNSRYEKFEDSVFSSAPRTMLAIDSFDIDATKTMRLSVYASSVSATGMSWHINSWCDNKLYSAGLSYIALS